MPDLPLILLIVLGLLAWLLLAVALVLVVVVLPGWSRLSGWGRSSKPEELGFERRAGDRRIGLPDTRAVRIERRSGIDRRRGPAAMA